MPALIPTEITAKIIWLGYNPDRNAQLETVPVEQADLTFDGISGEAHGGPTRLSCGRVIAQYARGTLIRNTRQLAILSAEELALMAKTMGVARLDPAWLGSSMVVEGIADFSHVPPSSRLQSDSGATLVVDMENRPCHLPAKVIDAHLPGRGRLSKRPPKDGAV